jgi:beta-phosphoglucomutase family hydrolase
MANDIQAVIWDLDGVILDSAEEHRLAWHRMAQEEGLPFTDEQFWASFGMRNDRIFSLLWKEVPPERVPELADRKEAYYREFIREKAAPLPGAIELLSELRAAGYPQALASSTPLKNIEVISEALGLNKYLDAFVSGEAVPRGKPAPDVFLKAAATLGIEPAYCLVIEDAVAGVQAAHAGGMKCIAVMGDRDLPGLREAELSVKDLTEVNLERIRALA